MQPDVVSCEFLSDMLGNGSFDCLFCLFAFWVARQASLCNQQQQKSAISNKQRGAYCFAFTILFSVAVDVAIEDGCKHLG
jgi:hypothetical protein